MAKVKTCDNCGDDLGNFEARRPDGQLWCPKCIKAVIKAVKRKPKVDRLVKIGREYAEWRNGFETDSVIMELNGKRCYTDRHFMLSELSKTPKRGGRCRQVWTDEIKKHEYTLIENVIPNCEPECRIHIPEDFINYLKPFGKNGEPNFNGMRVRFSIMIFSEYILVTDDLTDSEMSLRYADFENGTGLPDGSMLSVSVRYWNLLQPKTIAVYKEGKVLGIEESYDSFIDVFPHVLLSTTDHTCVKVAA